MIEIKQRQLVGEYDRTHRTVVSVESHMYDGKEVFNVYNGNTLLDSAKSMREGKKKAAIYLAHQQAEHEKGFIIEHVRETRV